MGNLTNTTVVGNRGIYLPMKLEWETYVYQVDVPFLYYLKKKR